MIKSRTTFTAVFSATTGAATTGTSFTTGYAISFTAFQSADVFGSLRCFATNFTIAAFSLIKSRTTFTAVFSAVTGVAITGVVTPGEVTTGVVTTGVVTTTGGAEFPPPPPPLLTDEVVTETTLEAADSPEVFKDVIL